ncbi:hypothetical protein [Halorubrum halodurans]|uniref:Uncharacterized protein n=1 Tax=Halorubrum halodurans TaxID=1383851 RepID=A0A256IKN6_9EURY|nr:hypothetical protein [Halorubrum halodurans]OYR57075.1 hypothetical protein DJ70_06660 [Halorubrum halodurans]
MGVNGRDLLGVLESDTDTITNAVATGRIDLDDLDRFVERVERGELEADRGVDEVVWIVGSLLRGDAGGWEEMEPAS